MVSVRLILRHLRNKLMMPEGAEMEVTKVPIDRFKLTKIIHDIYIFSAVEEGFDNMICDMSLLHCDNKGENEEEYINNLILHEGKSVFLPFSCMESFPPLEDMILLTLNKKTRQIERYDTGQADHPVTHKGADDGNDVVSEDCKLRLSDLSGVGFLIKREDDQLSIAPARSEAGDMEASKLEIVVDLDVFDDPMTSFIHSYIA